MFFLCLNKDGNIHHGSLIGLQLQATEAELSAAKRGPPRSTKTTPVKSLAPAKKSKTDNGKDLHCTCVHLERPTFTPFVSSVTTIPIACWNSTSGICLLQGGPYHLYRFPPAMVMEDTKEPENAPVAAPGSGDGGSGSTTQVGDSIPLPVCL